MSMGSIGGYNPRIVLDLVQQGDFSGALDQLERLQAAQVSMAGTSAKVVSAQKQTEESTYEVGSSYEILEEEIKRATTALEKEAVAAKWMAKQAADLDDVLTKLAQHEKEAATASVASAGAADKAATGARRGGDAAGYGALKWMILGNTLQDVQYGFEAIVNNIPQLVMSFGGSAGLAGGLGIAAVACQQLLAHLDDIKKFFGAELPRQLINDVTAMSKQLDELNKKEIKTKVDFTEIDLLDKKIKAVTEAQQAFENLTKKKSKDTQESGKLATEAIVEMGGGDDYESSAARVKRAAAASTPVEESAATAKLKQEIAEAEAGLQNLTLEGQVARGMDIEKLKEKLAGSQAMDTKERDRIIEEKVGRASEGYAGDLKWLTDLVKANPQKFAAQGAGPGLLPGLEYASRDQIAERDRLDKRQAMKEDEAKQAKKLEDARAKKQAEVDDAVEAAGDIAHGVDRDRLKDKAGQDERVRVAEAEAADLVRSIDHEKLLADQKAGRQNAAALGRQVNAAAPGLTGQLSSVISGNRLAQAKGDPSMRRENDVLNELQGDVAQVLKNSGQDPRAAHGVVVKALEDANRKYAEALGRTGNVVDALTQIVSASMSQLDAANQRIARQEQIAAQLTVKSNFGAINARRGQTQGQTGLMSIWQGN